MFSKYAQKTLDPLQTKFSCDISNTDFIDLLKKIYCLSGSWENAKTTMMGKSQIIERQVGRKNERFLGTLSK